MQWMLIDKPIKKATYVKAATIYIWGIKNATGTKVDSTF